MALHAGGLTGIGNASQCSAKSEPSGHIIPVAASSSPSVAFVINVSGSVASMMEQIGDELRLMAEREGLMSNEVAINQSIHEHAVQYISTSRQPTADVLTPTNSLGVEDPT